MKKRYKLIFVLFISFILTIIIYLLFYKEKDIYVAIIENDIYSDVNYSNYLRDNYKSKVDINFNNLDDLYNKLLNNKDNICYYIKNAKIITLDLGYKELNNYKDLDNRVILEYLNDLEKVLKQITKLNKNAYVIYYFNNNIISKNMDILSSKYDFYLIDKKIIKDNIYSINNKIFIHCDGHQNIYKYILDKNFSRQSKKV